MICTNLGWHWFCKMRVKTSGGERDKKKKKPLSFFSKLRIEITGFPWSCKWFAVFATVNIFVKWNYWCVWRKLNHSWPLYCDECISTTLLGMPSLWHWALGGTKPCFLSVCIFLQHFLSLEFSIPDCTPQRIWKCWCTSIWQVKDLSECGKLQRLFSGYDI